jgi:hypothetical protein
MTIGTDVAGGSAFSGSRAVSLLGQSDRGRQAVQMAELNAMFFGDRYKSIANSTFDGVNDI